MNMQTCIALDNAVCSAGGKELLCINHLRIAQGERIAIVGPNGAGKTTLLRLLSGFLLPTEGRITVLGHDLTKHLPAVQLRGLRGEIGQVLQGLHLVPRLSALDNVLIGSLARASGWRSWLRYFPEEEVAHATNALTSVGLLERSGTRSDRLSGGERQKVAIARLLVQGPRLILADEPTAALDPAAALEVCQLLVNAADGATLLTVVHTPALLPFLADRVIGLKQGRIAFDLPVNAVDDSRLKLLYGPVNDIKQASMATQHGHFKPRVGVAAP